MKRLLPDKPLGSPDKRGTSFCAMFLSLEASWAAARNPALPLFLSLLSLAHVLMCMQKPLAFTHVHSAACSHRRRMACAP